MLATLGDNIMATELERVRAEKARVLGEAEVICKAAEAAGRDFTPDERERVDTLLAQARTAKARIERLEQEELLKSDDLSRRLWYGDGMAMAGGGRPVARRGFGCWSKAMAEATGHRFGRKELEPAGLVTVPALLDTVAPLEGKAQSILQLIPSQRLQGTGQYAFLRETVRTHNAAPVTEGALKPTSVYSVVKVEGHVSTIAHLTEPIPRQYLADFVGLEQYVDGALREGLLLELEAQVLTGDGTGTGEGANFTGIQNTDDIQTQAWDTDILTTTRKAITKLELVNIAPTAWVMHPEDWESLELLTLGDDGHYALAGAEARVPVDRAERRLWAVPVVLSREQPAGLAFLVDFAGSTQLWERETATITWNQAGYDAQIAATDFQRNLLRFLAETRAGFAVTRPQGVVSVDLTGAASGS